MDLFYFFFHLGIEMLKPGGRMGMITTSYWPTADGAKNLRKHIRKTTEIDSFIFTGGLQLFKDAPGQSNMITILEKSDSAGSYSFPVKIFPAKIENSSFEKSLKILGEEMKTAKLMNEIEIKSTALEGDFWSFEQKTSNKAQSNFAGCEMVLLDSLMEIDEGLHTGADKVTERHIKLFPELGKHSGNGIMVLKESELKALKLPSAESKILIPLVKNSDVREYLVRQSNPKLFVMYIDGKTDLSKLPSISSHLEKFKKVMKLKRGFQNGTHEWYQLHWPRSRALFENPKIMVPYRANSNRFALDITGLTGSADIFFLSRKQDCKYSLEFLVGWLNSSWAEAWCKENLKKKGDMREYKPTILRLLPVPNLDLSLAGDKVIISQVERIVKLAITSKLDAIQAKEQIDLIFGPFLKQAQSKAA